MYLIKLSNKFTWFSFQEDEQYDYEAGDKEEAAAGPKAEEGEVEQQAPVPVPDTTPILPTRVVPTLLSPSFEDEASGGGSLSMTVKPVEEMIMPTAVLSEAPPQIYSSISFPVRKYVKWKIFQKCPLLHKV